jgi:hypothetical protein
VLAEGGRVKKTRSYVPEGEVVHVNGQPHYILRDKSQPTQSCEHKPRALAKLISTVWICEHCGEMRIVNFGEQC